jgi:hypothetical protein
VNPSVGLVYRSPVAALADEVGTVLFGVALIVVAGDGVLSVDDGAAVGDAEAFVDCSAGDRREAKKANPAMTAKPTSTIAVIRRVDASDMSEPPATCSP